MKYEQFVARCQAIAKIGRKFSTDPYALDNYEELEIISGQMMSELSGQEIINIYELDIYPTPSSSVRVVIFNDKGQLLMVRESQDRCFAVPGGWCEVFDSLQECAVKEVFQETGLTIKTTRLLAIFQRERYKDYPSVLSEQVHYFLAEVVGGDLKPNYEIMSVDYYDLDNLPQLSKKNSRAELLKAIEIAIGDLPVYYD